MVCKDSLVDVFLLQLVVLLESIVDYGFSVELNENGGDIEITTRCLDFDEIINIWMPFIHKKNIIGRTFTFNIVQKLNLIVGRIISEQTQKESNVTVLSSQNSSNTYVKQKKQSKSKKRKQAVVTSSDDNSSSDDDIDTDCNRMFNKFFEYKKKYPIIVSQMFQFVSNDERKKIVTPGEGGTHLVKIEMTDTRDLASCKGEKFFWQKVAKKGVFLLNIKKSEADKKVYESLLNILGDVGEKLSKIKNAKFETSSFDVSKK